MTILWRISNFVDLNGEGGLIASARWHSEGKPIVYLADSPAGAMLERIVHLMDMNEERNLPRIYQLLRVSAPNEITTRTLSRPAQIDRKEQPELTRPLGDAWLASLESPLARVPSAIVPRTWNYLLNPDHPDAKQVVVAEVIQERFDNRLFRFGVR